MAAAGRTQERRAPRYVYVARFGSHRCGSVLQLGARRKAWGPEEPRGAATAGGAGLGERPPQPRAPAAARGDPRPASAAGLSQKNLSKKFDFPSSLCEASTKIKKRKKDSVWNSVSKVISRMLEENEKYRLRLKCQQSPTERMNPSLESLTKEDCEEFKDGT